MKLLFIGDIFAEAGKKAVQTLLPKLRREHALDFVVANAENVYQGKGITEKYAEDLFKAGVDVLTSGNHAFDQAESRQYYNRESRLLRPENYSRLAPGRGWVIQEVYSGVKLAVLNLAGRIHMEPADCPFAEADRLLEALKGKADICFVDMHAEATSETRAMGWHLDGRVAAVIGSHSHVPTADEEILPGGTAYLTDAGMTGPYRSIIGMRIAEPLQKFRTGLKARFVPATDDARFCAALVEIEESNGLARKIERIQIRM